jgi:hypothetical protein
VNCSKVQAISGFLAPGPWRMLENSERQRDRDRRNGTERRKYTCHPTKRKEMKERKTWRKVFLSMKTSSLVFLAFVLIIALPASAQYATVIHACSRDATIVCEGSQSGQNRFNECVKLRFSDLSESCKASLVRIATVPKVCAVDIQDQWHLIKPDAGRMFLCVKQHFSALSAPCKEGIAKAAERK